MWSDGVVLELVYRKVRIFLYLDSDLSRRGCVVSVGIPGGGRGPGFPTGVGRSGGWADGGPELSIPGQIPQPGWEQLRPA
jgi:hypothetical protein